MTWVLVSIFGIWAITYSCYHNTLHGEWVFDDNFAVVNNPDVLPSTPLQALLTHDFWGQDISKPDSHKSYRPFTVLTFRLNHAIHGMNTFGYHLFNVVLHCTTTLLVYAMAQMVFGDFWVSFVSALLFGLHPIHTEAVSSIVGRSEGVCSVFYLLAIFAVQKAREPSKWKWLFRVGYILCYILATLSKETGYTVLGVLFFQHFLIPPNSAHFLEDHQINSTTNKTPITNTQKGTNIGALTNKTAGKTNKHDTSTPAYFFVELACCALAYVLVRTWLTTTFTLHNFRHLENPIAFAPTPLARGLSAAHLHAQYLALLLCPMSLSADYSFDAIPLVHSVADPRNIRTLLAYASLFSMLFVSAFGAFYRKRKESGKVLWLLLFGGLSFLPASNLVFYVGTMLAERLLYIPSIPFCVLLAWASVRTARAARLPAYFAIRCTVAGIVVMCTLSMCGWYAWQTHTRNLDWQNEERLFLSALRVTPGSAKVWQNVGILHRRSQSWTQALEAFAHARSIEPNYCELDYWDGITYLNMGKTEEALKHLLKSVDCMYTQAQAVTALNKIYNILITSSQNNTLYLLDWANVLEKIDRTHESAYYLLQAAILLHNQSQHLQSVKTLSHLLDLLSLTSPDSSTPPSMSKAEIVCSAHMWIGAGYLVLENFTGAVEHMRHVAGMETPLSPLPLFSDGSPLLCPTLTKQGKQALGGMYGTQIQNGQNLDARSRLELSDMLLEGGDIQAAHYQAFLVAEELAGKDPVRACKVLEYSIARTKQWESEQSYKQMFSLFSKQCVPSINNRSKSSQQKEEL
eukprot:Phypoly_transcript_02845.p1 GENE.Phypoly_transcript_02845~~Phypoly_transcript_02845.p1  ORF type:complete len:801 (-),score=117.52 Phypoly_transcript_02845:36-2438(-)